MANHVLEYVIRARDAASAVLNSVSEKFRGLAATVKSAMSQTKEAVNNVRVDEKFIHTEAVLFPAEYGYLIRRRNGMETIGFPKTQPKYEVHDAQT